MVPYAQTKKDVLQAIEAREKGLSEKQAAERLSRYGRNVLEEKAKKTLLQKIWEQARDPMVVILIAAAAVSGLLKEAADTVIILAVVALNTVIGLVQESKAEKAIEALKKSAPRRQSTA